MSSTQKTLSELEADWQRVNARRFEIGTALRARLDAMLEDRPPAPPMVNGHEVASAIDTPGKVSQLPRKVSAAARRKMSLAGKARWARVRREQARATGTK